MNARFRGLVAVAGALVFCVAAPSVVSADEKTCSVDEFTRKLTCVLVASPAPPLSVRLSSDIPLVWMRAPMNVGELIARDIGCVRTSEGLREEGVGYVVTLINTATRQQLYLDYVCTWPGDPPPVPPPAPPTPAELARANAEVLTLQPALSPPGSIGGLTGLESWLWCDDPGPIDTSVSLRGWTASGGVELVQLKWAIDGADSRADSTLSCGSEEAPSVTWTPETIGDYSVALTAVWAGSWDLTWNGIPMGTFPLGPVSIAAPPMAYPVDEYRGELTG